MNAMPTNTIRPGRGTGDHRFEDAGNDPGDLHPSCGLLTDLLQRYLSGDLDKDGALQQFSKILDLYPSGDNADSAATESARREFLGKGPAPRPFDSKAARAELHGCKLRLDTTTGRRVLESAGTAAAPRYNPQQAIAEWHGRG
jgi:hypothetical protein